jgi:hypothetical protein
MELRMCHISLIQLADNIIGGSSCCKSACPRSYHQLSSSRSDLSPYRCHLFPIRTHLAVEQAGDLLALLGGDLVLREHFGICSIHGSIVTGARAPREFPAASSPQGFHGKAIKNTRFFERFSRSLHAPDIVFTGHLVILIGLST